MTSKVEICNHALAEAKYDETIESLDERSVAAERCKRFYDLCRKEVLCAYPWAFATKFEELPKIKDEVETGKAAFSYPKECLSLICMYKDRDDYRNKNFRTPEPNNNRVALVDGLKAVIADSDTPFAEYIYDQQIEDNFPSSFVKVLYLTIAMKLAKLSGFENDDLKFIAAQLSQAVEEARINSVSEDDNHLNVDDDFYIDARG